ncbi:FAD dependent oxidoreductase-domain-containing protein [Dactylonectria estremocensis]|uniref:FAD dependent oxidoreductase-domain-containing protein n=1 Tax=Dactylonectria estremocensis TaxID=1079267 RepID=A0A9P9E9N0_9HYPO|nr:FAD dependent oxidoreductase-domain-containing protein [Dactylonectria estremocensis]
MGSVISTFQDTIFTVSSVVKTISHLNTQFSSLLSRANNPPGLPVPNPTSSYWLDDPPFPALCEIQGELPEEADVVIIGSGIAGVSVAKTLLELSTKDEAPLRVVVCEARQLCSGATGRNGGHIKSTPYEVFSGFKAKLGPERASKLVRFQMKHLPTLLEVGATVPAGEVREVRTVDLFIEQKDLEKARRDVEELKECVPEVVCEVWDAEGAREEFGVNASIAGAISYKAGALWPYRLVTGVWDSLLQLFPSLTIMTQTAVEAVDHTPSSPYAYSVKTSRGTVKAGHVIHNTNAFAPQLIPSLRGSLTGALAHMSAQRPGDAFPASHGQLSWSIVYSPGFDYVTQRPDGDDGAPGDLMVGGGFFRSRESALDQMGVWDDARMDALPGMHIRGVMPTTFEPRWGSGGAVKKAWTGILGLTGDVMPLVGRVPGSAPQSGSGEWVAAGFNGEGMVWAWLSGTALAVMVLGKEGEELEKGVGRPGGKLAEWFPQELKVDGGRLRRARLQNLADAA